MSQFETNSQAQISNQERSKPSSNRQLGTSNLQNGQNVKNIDNNEYSIYDQTLGLFQEDLRKQISKQFIPSSYGYSQNIPQVQQYPQFNYPLIGQQTMKEQENEEQIQRLTKDNETLRYQWRTLEQDNQKLKNDNLQLSNRDKINNTEIQGLQYDIYKYSRDQMFQLKNENKRLMNTIQDDQYQLLDLQKLKKQVELNKGLEIQISDLEQQLAMANKQVQEQKRQNSFQDSEIQTQKDTIEKFKAQLKELTQNNDAQSQKNDSLLNDNRKMKQALDMINKEFTNQQEQNQVLIQKINQLNQGSKDQINNLQKNIQNLNFQNDQLKNQILQLQQKEKELQNAQNIDAIINFRLQFLIQILEQRQIDQYVMTIQTGKNEYQKLALKSQSQEQDMWKMKEQVNQLNTQNQMLQNKCYQLERSIEDSLSKSQIQSADLKGTLDRWKNYGLSLEQEIKKREVALLQLENEYVHLQSQLKGAQENEVQFRNERAITLQKMKEMHDDLLLYEKKCNQLERDLQQQQEQNNIAVQNQGRLEQEKQQLNQEVKNLMDELHRTQNQNDLKQREFDAIQMKYDSENNAKDREVQNLHLQNSMLQEKNNQLENDLAREKEQLFQMESRIRSLEAEIQNLQFKQTLKQQYSWNQEVPNNQSNQIEQTENSQIYSGMGGPYSIHGGFQNFQQNNIGVHNSQKPKPMEVQNAPFQINEFPDHRRTSSQQLIKSKNYDLRFQQQQKNQYH
ncbi:unnamed protein product (macronuclear) [Paramecium tetraurelia]|uniref:Uncharacterized protein n=1 Tax=Paramecium tetraurelia TaxID=5888 RepID=A0BUH8_PARTE|nr:uncharacterized protein GSPATT00032427001 [Paramecium tetraurelia]CAK62195.1 unnamed protein product [Paramecium tetraurelia]|eukprot:XP_001429593.1 hypothetical protein (macronuclear) [Paramecium tetraurelia strain d4-2]